MQDKILEKLQTLGIAELMRVTELCELNGDYVNNDTLLPNGQVAKILDDNKKYLCTQVEITGSGKCYGVAADDSMLAVFRYGDEGKDCKLIAWVKL